MGSRGYTKEKSLSYADAGVDIEQADALISDIKKAAARTSRPGVLAGVGGFGALFEVPIDRYKQPVLVSGTDGVGTKLKLATAMQQHNTVGIDLVAMCVNDIITVGAEPLYFLDYIATGKLNNKQIKDVMCGIADGCEQSGAALIGGETAELPGMYQSGDYDLAGFCVGVVEKDKIIDANKVKAGDVLIALPSSGVHSNGYSLIRHIIDKAQIKLDTPYENTTIGKTLLTPTKIYAEAIAALTKSIDVHAIAHITGGGLIENIPRVLPPFTQAVIDTETWQWPAIFKWIQENGNVEQQEMYRTFNVGVGMVICVAKKDADVTLSLFKAIDEEAWIIGEVKSSKHKKPQTIIQS